MTSRRIFIARPRLDCSFKFGAVPEKEGPPRNDVLLKFGHFVDGILQYHLDMGDIVQCQTRALWQFELEEIRQISKKFDIVYMPHKLKSQFPAGHNLLFYKNAPLFDHFTIDPSGWGASLSFIPPEFQKYGRSIEFATLSSATSSNHSIFKQPPLRPLPINDGYILFICQLPHDETIKFHSNVKVEDALGAVVQYAEQYQIPLVVKGHPANPKSMDPLKVLVARSESAIWIDDYSIHSCIEGANQVFLVNSGSGFEVMLHDKTLLRFGSAEYDSIVPLVHPCPNEIAKFQEYKHDAKAYVDFLMAFAQNCVALHDPRSYAHAIEYAIRRMATLRLSAH